MRREAIDLAATGDRPWTITQSGLRLHIHLTPKSGRDGVDGIIVQPDGRPVVKARVRAVPEDGKANLALIQTIAKLLKLPQSAFSLEAGGKSRNKTLNISGDGKSIADKLELFLAEKA